MKYFTLLILAAFHLAFAHAQKESRFSIEINYGLNGNFFVRSYDEVGGPPAKRFFKKDFVGSIGGLEMQYRLNQRSRLSVAFARSKNSAEVNYTDNILPLTISNFNITHINKFFQLYYDRDFSGKISGLSYQAGLIYLRMHQQELEIASPVNGGALIEERNYKHNKLEEGGIFIGLHYSKKIDTKFDLGIKSRVYYLISTSSFEAVTLTPTLTYHF